MSHGHRLSERAEVAGFQGLVFEQRTSSVSVPVGSPAKPLCLTPGWGVSLEGPRPPPTGRPSPVPVCPEPSDFVPVERVTRGIFGVEPLGIPLGSADIFLDKNGRQALLSGDVTTRWETVPASAAPPQLFAWEPPCQGDGGATGTGPVYCDVSE